MRKFLPALFTILVLLTFSVSVSASDVASDYTVGSYTWPLENLFGSHGGTSDKNQAQTSDDSWSQNDRGETAFRGSAETIADQGLAGSGITWTLDTDGNLTLSGFGAMQDYATPEETPWYPYINNIYFLTVEDGITTIGKYAFTGAANLNSILMADSVSVIGEAAFAGCTSLAYPILSDALDSIGAYAFAGCSALPSVVLPDTVRAVGTYAFSDCCGMEFASINSAAVLDDCAFAGCSSMLTVFFAGNAPLYFGEDVFTGASEDFLLTISEERCNDSTSGWQEFLASTPLPKYEIIFNLFDEDSIPCGAEGSEVMATLDITGTLTISGNGEMMNFEEDLARPWGGSTINFIRKVVIEDGITSIGNCSFALAHNLTSVEMADSVESIGAAAFVECVNLNSVDMSHSLTSIGEQAFAYCSSLETALIPAPVQVVYPAVFAECWNLEYVYIEGAPELPDYLFANCYRLHSVYCLYTPPVLGTDVFLNVSPDFCLYVPDNAYEDSSSGWQEYLAETGLPYELMSFVDMGLAGDNIIWTLETDGTLTLAGTGPMWDFVVDYSIAERPWEAYINDIRKVVIRDGITYVSTFAFVETPNVAEIDLGNTVSSFGFQSFAGCYSLESIVIPASVKTAGGLAFLQCTSLESVSVEGATTFDGAFAGCPELRTVYFYGDAPYAFENGAFSSDNSLYLNLFVPESRVNDPYSFWMEFLDSNPDYLWVVLPYFSGLCGDSVTWRLDTEEGLAAMIIEGTGDMWDYESPEKRPWSIYTEIFGGDIIQLLTVKEGVTSIGDFAMCEAVSLTEIRLPDSLISIGLRAFENCTGLTGDLVIPNGVEEIGIAAFNGCSGLNGTLSIPAGVTTIGAAAFLNCSGLNGQLVIPEGVEFIGEGAFGFCTGFTGSLTIPSTVKTIDTDAFYSCSGFDGELILSEGIESIGAHAFMDCTGFTGSLTIPSTLTDISEQAFQNCCSLNGTLTIADGVETIGSGAFRFCHELTGSLTIPASVTSIGELAFGECAFLESAYFKGDVPAEWGNGAFSDTSEDFVIYYNDVDGYGWTSPTWEAPDGIVYNTAVYGASEEDSITFTYSVNEDGTATITGFTGEASGDLVIPGEIDGYTVTAIGDSAFEECTGFTGSLTIPDGVTSIGPYAFIRCSGLTGSLVIPDSVSFIGNHAFYECSGFNGSLTIPDSIDSIGYFAFYGCSGLTGSLIIPDSVTSIGYFVFYECSGFTGSLIIPDSVTSIGGGAFIGCSSLESAYFEGDVPAEWGSEVFSGMSTDFIIYYNDVDGYGWTSPTWEAPDGMVYNTAVWNADEPMEAEDLNGDGIIDEADALYLLRHTLLPERYPIAAADTDYDRDGTVTANDAAWLKKQLDALLPTRD